MTDPLDAQRYQQVAEIVGQILSLPEPDWAQAVAQACGEDPVLEQHVLKLLDSQRRLAAGGFLDKTGPIKLARNVENAGDLLVGENLGRYVVQQRIASGGMGHVYRAVRLDDFRQTVAIKVLRIGMDSADFVRRFQAERQLLADLRHPHIATLLDGGTTPDGRPYLVMEFVDGVHILRYANQQQMNVRQRLALFQAVASAIGYAHSRKVLHRDIKPSNVLVTSSGQVKLVDFGIAKIVAASEFGDVAERTKTRDQTMTLDYASPEQFRGHTLGAGSDIYSLAVLLYELLTGIRPFRLQGLALVDAERLLCETIPDRPSTVVLREIAAVANDRSPAAQDLQQFCGTTPPELHRTLRGDLDKIVMMALRKEPERRYSSVEAFAADVEHYLQGRPVAAHDDTWFYRARKFATRNPSLVALGAVVVFSYLAGFFLVSTGLIIATLVAGLAGTTFGLVRARRAQQQADQRFAETRELATTILFDIDEGLRSLAGTRSLRQYVMGRVLEKLDRLERDVPRHPGLAAELAQGYYRAACVLGKPDEDHCGQFEQAILASERSASLVRQLLVKSPDDIECLRTLVAAEQLIVQIQHAIGKAGDTLVSRQEGIVRQLTATVERRPHDEGLQQSYIAALLLQAKMYFEQSRFAESQSIVEAALARSRAPGRHGPQREFQRLERAALTALSVYHLQQGHAAAARESMQELLRLAESMAAECPPLHPDAVALCQTFALQSLVLQQNQAWDEAQVAIGRAIDLHRRWLDADPSNVAARQSMAALHLDAQRLACGRGQLETARRHCLDALEILSPLAGSEVKSHVALLAQLNSQLGDLESAQGHYAEAEAAHQRQLLYGQRLYALDPNSPLPLAGLLSCWQKLATCAENLGNHAEHQRRWTEFDKLAAELAATELSSTGQFTLAQTAVERGKSMARCGNWRQALSMAPHVIAFAREQIAARAAAVVPLLNGLIQVCVLVATESGPESVELPHEARAYCQACIAIVEGAPDQMPDGEQELLRQAVQAWRVQLTRIDTALVSAFR